MYDLLQLMYQDGFLSSTELTALRKTCRDLRENPVRVLRSLNIVSQPEIQGLLQRFYGHDAATEELIENIGDEQRSLLPVDLALHYNAVGIAEEGPELLVLLEDPTERRALESLGFFLGKRIRPVVATASQLARALAKVYGVDVADLRLTTVLEASRGVAGGVVYDSSQIQPSSRDDEDFLVDHGVRMGTLDTALGRNGSLPPAAREATATKGRNTAPALLPLHASAEPFGDDAGSDVLGARLAQSLSNGDVDRLSADLSEHAPLAKKSVPVAPPVVAPDPSNPSKSVFDDFEGMEFVEAIDDSVAAANDALLVSPAADGDDAGSSLALENADDEPEALVPETPGEPSFDFEPAEDALTAEEGDALTALSADEDELEELEELETGGEATLPSTNVHEPAPDFLPVSKASVSKALVKIALARTRVEALEKVNALLADEGVEILDDADGTGALSVRQAEAGVVVGDVEALSTLPAALDPLRPLLKQIFRLRAAG